jgi:hypothetical protein
VRDPSSGEVIDWKEIIVEEVSSVFKIDLAKLVLYSYVHYAHLSCQQQSFVTTFFGLRSMICLFGNTH